MVGWDQAVSIESDCRQKTSELVLNQGNREKQKPPDKGERGPQNIPVRAQGGVLLDSGLTPPSWL